MTEENPWKVCGSREIYKNPWIRVREDEVIHPDGQEGIYGVVEALRIATGVVALTPEREVYLVGQYRYPIEQYSWEIIEGGSDEGEDPLTAAKRELREEGGLIADKWTQLGGVFHLSNCVSSEIGYVYLAQNLRITEAEPEGSEVLQLKKVAFDKCLEMLDSAEITDAVSIIGLLRAERFLRSQD